MSRRTILLLSFILSCAAALVLTYPTHANGTATITHLDCTSVNIQGTFDKTYLDVDVMNSDIPGGWQIGVIYGLTSPDGSFNVTIPFTAPVPDGTNLFVFVHDRGESPYDWSSIAELRLVAHCDGSTQVPNQTPTPTPFIPTNTPTPINPPVTPTNAAPPIVPSIRLTCTAARISGRTGVATRFVRATVTLASNLGVTLASGTVRVRAVPGASFRINLRFPRQQPGTRLIIAVGEWDGTKFIRPAVLTGLNCS